MLGNAERSEIQSELRAYPRKRAAAPEALKIVQRHHGWVSDAHLSELAALLDMTPAELDSVATFYNLVFRKPVGKHVILVCDSVSCWVMGYDAVSAHLKKRLGIDFGQTTADGLFTLLPVVCLGACDLAPVMMIDEELFGHLDTAKVNEILARYSAEGTR